MLNYFVCLGSFHPKKRLITPPTAAKILANVEKALSLGLEPWTVSRKEAACAGEKGVDLGWGLGLENLLNPSLPRERTMKLASYSPNLGDLCGLQTLESSAKEAPQARPDTKLKGEGRLTPKGEGENLSHMTPGFLNRSVSARWA